MFIVSLICAYVIKGVFLFWKEACIGSLAPSLEAHDKVNLPRAFRAQLTRRSQLVRARSHKCRAVARQYSGHSASSLPSQDRRCGRSRSSGSSPYSAAYVGRAWFALGKCGKTLNVSVPDNRRRTYNNQYQTSAFRLSSVKWGRFRLGKLMVLRFHFSLRFDFGRSVLY